MLHPPTPFPPGSRWFKGRRNTRRHDRLGHRAARRRAPAELAQALKAKKTAWEGWQKLSYSHQREWAEAINNARRPETRARRIQQAVEAAIRVAGKKKNKPVAASSLKARPKK